MNSCELCSKIEESLSLREATHKEHGKKWVCQDCWTKLYDKNQIVAGSSSGGMAGCNMGCVGCRNA